MNSIDNRSASADNTAALERAKQPRTILAGPYGHPVHPILVTIPIGTWTASVIFDIAALLTAERAAVFAEGAYWLIGIGILGALLAALFGVLDLLTITRGTKAFRTGMTHMILNLVVVALFVIDFALRAAQGYEQPTALGLVLSIIALAGLTVSGWLGGKLAYHYGIRVAAEHTQAEGFK